MNTASQPETDRPTETAGQGDYDVAVDLASAPARGGVGRAVQALMLREGVPAMLAIAVVAVVFQLQASLFLRSTNLSNLVVQIIPLALVALAEVVVILMREIDLSLGSIAGLTAAVGGTLITNHGYAWWTGILAMLVCGAALGGVQGGLIVIGRIPAFVVTLGGYLAFLGLQLNILGSSGGVNVYSKQITDLTTLDINRTVGLVGTCVAYSIWLVYYVSVLRASRAAKAPSRSRWAGWAKPLVTGVLAVGGAVVLNGSRGIPLGFVLVLVIVMLVAGFLKETAAGRHVYAIGGNPEAPSRAGVRVQTLRWAGFVVAGMLSACAGLALLSYDQSASTTTGGSTLLLEGIGAAVIGGVSLFGGKGNAWAALSGAFVMGGIANGLDLTQQSEPTQYVIEGVVVVLAVLLDSTIRRGVEFRWSRVRRRIRQRFGGSPVLDGGRASRSEAPADPAERRNA